MSRANRLRGISITLWEFRSGYILSKRGERARLKRQSHRIERQMAKALLRDLDLDEWTTGDFEIPTVMPTTESALGHTIFLGG